MFDESRFFTVKSQHYIHPQALVEVDASVGAGSRVWAFAHILGGAIVGEDCNVCDHTFIEGGARVANRVTVKCGVYLWDGLVLEDDVFVAYMKNLFSAAKQYVIIYSSNMAQDPRVHVTYIKHRMVTKWIDENIPDWKLIENIPNPYPIRHDTDLEGNFADFYLYRKDQG